VDDFLVELGVHWGVEEELLDGVHCGVDELEESPPPSPAKYHEICTTPCDWSAKAEKRLGVRSRSPQLHPGDGHLSRTVAVWVTPFAVMTTCLPQEEDESYWAWLRATVQPEFERYPPHDPWLPVSAWWKCHRDGWQ